MNARGWGTPLATLLYTLATNAVAELRDPSVLERLRALAERAVRASASSVAIASTGNLRMTRGIARKLVGRLVPRRAFLAHPAIAAHAAGA